MTDRHVHGGTTPRNAGPDSPGARGRNGEADRIRHQGTLPALDPEAITAWSLPARISTLAIVLLLFGSTRLPKIARSLGQASKEFKQGVEEGSKDDGPADEAKSS